MKITKFLPVLPVVIEMDIKDGKQLDVFVLINLSQSTILVPDEDQLAEIDNWDNFKKLVWEKISEINKVNIKIPNLPEHILKSINTAKNAAYRHVTDITEKVN